MAITLLVVSDVVPEAMLGQVSPEVLQGVVEDLVSGARDFWIKKAGDKLHSSRRDYIQGIQEVTSGKGFASVALVGVLPLMVEEGIGAFDMRDTLLGASVPIAAPGGKGKHVNAKGKFYRSIPFRHQTPGTSGQGGGAPMGSAYSGHAAVTNAEALGKAVYAAAKALVPSTGMPGGPVTWGGRLPPGLAPKLKGIHSTDIYAGMVKQQKTYAVSTQNTYTTFRTISEDSDPAKWLHPGITAAHIADDVQKYLEDTAPAAMAALVSL